MAPAMDAQQYPLEKLDRDAFSTTIRKLQEVGMVSILPGWLGGEDLGWLMGGRGSCSCADGGCGW